MAGFDPVTKIGVLQVLHAGLAMTHARLLGAVWGVEYGGELEYLRTYVRQLRKKLEDDPAEPRYLLTDSHYGYRFADLTVNSNGGEHTKNAALMRSCGFEPVEFA